MTMVTNRRAPTGRRERKKTQVRERILAVALELFSRHGLDAVTVEHIADVADLGKGTIYNYFPTKEDIVVAFMADLELRVQARVTRLTASTGSLESLLTGFVRHQFQLKKPYHAFVRVMLGQMLQRTPQYMPYLVEMQKAIDPNLQRIFDGAQDRGLIRARVSAPDFIFAFKTLHFGLSAVWAMEGPPFRQTNLVARSAIRIFCQGLEAHSS
jgi:AcrR family transcriptional regulator